MAKLVYDQEAGEELHIDVVHEIDDRPGSADEWVSAMRRLNAINDPLARSIIALHRDCGSGTGECDQDPDRALPMSERTDWGCATTSLVAAHFGIEHRAEG